MHFRIWHHHVRLTRVVTVGVWEPDVLDVSSFYGEGAVELSGKSRIFPFLIKIGINSVLLSITNKMISK